MNYYNEIKQKLINNEINKKVKEYSKNKYELQKYYNVGKLLVEAGNNYGEGITNDRTIDILICKNEEKFVIEYCSDDRIAVRKYELV